MSESHDHWPWRTMPEARSLQRSSGLRAVQGLNPPVADSHSPPSIGAPQQHRTIRIGRITNTNTRIQTPQLIDFSVPELFGGGGAGYDIRPSSPACATRRHPPGGRASWPERGSATPPAGAPPHDPKGGRSNAPRSSNGTGAVVPGFKIFKTGVPGEIGLIRKGALPRAGTLTTWAHQTTTALRCSACCAQTTTTTAPRSRQSQHEG